MLAAPESQSQRDGASPWCDSARGSMNLNVNESELNISVSIRRSFNNFGPQWQTKLQPDRAVLTVRWQYKST